MSCDTSCAVNKKKRRRVSCTVYTLRRLQQIAISCKRIYNNFFSKKKNEVFQFFTQFHHDELEEDGLVQVALLQIRGGDGS